MRSATAEVVCERVVKEPFSVCSLCCSRWSIDVTECGVVDLESDQPAVQAFFNVRVTDMLFERNCSAASSMIDVADHVVSRQGKLLVLNFLQTDDVQVHSPCECTKGVDFGGVGYCVDVDGCNIIAVVVGHIYNTIPSSTLTAPSRLCFLDLDLKLLVDVEEVSVSLPSVLLPLPLDFWG